MNNIIFKNITEFNQAQNLPEPENPLFSIGQKKLNDEEIENCVSSKEAISYSNQFYIISLKNIVSGEIIYGRTKYDCSTGTLLFSAPNQTYIVKDIVISSESWFIAFHEDFIRGLDIQKRIKKYNFFNYSVNEALHLSEKEIGKLLKEQNELFYNVDRISYKLLVACRQLKSKVLTLSILLCNENFFNSGITGFSFLLLQWSGSPARLFSYHLG